VRTLDAIHLASADFVRRSKQTLTIATYDQRLAAAARAFGFSLHDLVGNG
jgi:predicted nucleic acid-binding protein